MRAHGEVRVRSIVTLVGGEESCVRHELGPRSPGDAAVDVQEVVLPVAVYVVKQWIGWIPIQGPIALTLCK